MKKINLVLSVLAAVVAAPQAEAQTSRYYARQRIQPAQAASAPSQAAAPSCQPFRADTWVTAASGYYLSQSAASETDATAACAKEYAKPGKYGLCGYYPAEKAVVWFPTTSVATGYAGFRTSLCPQK